MEKSNSEKTIFEKLSAVNVNEKTEKKNGLTYLSWARAWAEIMKIYPSASYEVVKFNGLPYVDSELGIMVYTKVTIDNITHEMWLPVMDYKNDAMKTDPYSYKSKNKQVFVNGATMFDINKSIMRCLAKNLAMFGLGLYIYAGEDLPEDEKQKKEESDSAMADLSKKREVLIKTVEEAAQKGIDSMKNLWTSLSTEDVKLIGELEKQRIYKIAKEVCNAA